MPRSTRNKQVTMDTLHLTLIFLFSSLATRLSFTVPSRPSTSIFFLSDTLFFLLVLHVLVFFSSARIAAAQITLNQFPAGSHQGNREPLIPCSYSGDLVNHTSAVVHFHALHLLSLAVFFRSVSRGLGGRQESEEGRQECKRVKG